MLRVTVQDDGDGFDAQHCWPEDGRRHLGIIGMEQRVESLGGNLRIWSTPGEGTLVMFRIPASTELEEKNSASCQLHK
jgi:signal transduction histidine kinase